MEFGFASVEAVLGHANYSSLHAIFGSPDDIKFISSMNLFELAGNTTDPFGAALTLLANGRRDERTIALLDNRGSFGRVYP